MPTSPSSSQSEPEPLQRRIQWIAALTLGGILAAHLLLETGRDALFLANIPAERLPFVYLAGALLALGVVRLAQAGSGTVSPARVAGLQVLAAVSTVVFFWWATVSTGVWVYYALYVWSGVLTSATVGSFWLLVAEHFTLAEAKQRFVGVTLGGSVGAVAGAGAATALAPLVPPSALLLVAGGLFALSAIGPLSLPAARPDPEDGASTGATDSAPDSLSESLRSVATHPYARRVALLVALGSVTLTLGDYLFKSIAAEEIPGPELAEWFARVYLALNLLSIVALAAGVRPLISRLGVDRSLVLLPALVAGVSVGVLIGPPLLFAAALKVGGDTVRHSIHKTASEILYLPMEPSLRGVAKGAIDLVAHNAARSVAALGILVLTMLPASRTWTVAALLLLSLGWALMALRLRGPYLEVFRRTLRHGSIETRIELPELDIETVGPLLRALSSPDERNVLGAIDLLHERKRCNLIPTLILYHPSPDVVVRAIDLFAATGREEVLDFSQHLLDHEYARVRSAIVRAEGVLAPNRERLEQLLGSDCPCVRVSAAAGLLAHGWIDGERAGVELREAAAHHEPDTRMAVANAAKLQYSPPYFELLAALARDEDPEVAREAVRGMHHSGEARFTRTLVALLGRRVTRDLVRDALIERGTPALEELARALRDTATETPVLRHVPRTLSRFPTRQAVPVLLSALGEMRSGMVRYKVLRGLQGLMLEVRLQREERELVSDVLRSTVERALELLRWDASLERGGRRRASAGGELLHDLVRDKQRLAMGRVLLIVSLLYPEENIARIRAGVRSDRGRRQASGIELLENLVPSDLRPVVRGLWDPGDAAHRLRLAAGRADPPSYEQSVRELAADDSEALRAFAMYHASEISIRIDGADDDDAVAEGGRVEGLRNASLALLERLPELMSRRAFGTGTTPAG